MPPPTLLIERGPLVQVTVSVPKGVADAMVRQGTPVPAPVTGMALIDTGAMFSGIDDAAAQALGVPVVDVIQTHSASHANTEMYVYPIYFDVVGSPIGMDVSRCAGCALSSQGLLMLLGRDVLSLCLLVYNGTTGAFSLSI